MIGYASIEELSLWATAQMERAPDFVIGADYMHRWWIIPRNEYQNVYLHKIMHSDDDRAMHDHPWDNVSFVISGSYVEHTPDGVFIRGPGSVVHRKATDLHRLEVVEGEPAVTLFMTGPKVREWGFACPKGWRIWPEFVDARDSGQIGKGCD